MRRRKSWGLWVIEVLIVGLCVAGVAAPEAAALDVKPDEPVVLGPYTLEPGQTLGPLEVLISVNRSTDGETTFVASCSAPWLTLEPPSGAIPGVIKAKATVSALMEGSYETTVTVQSNAGNTDTVRVTLTVNRMTSQVLSISPHTVALGPYTLGPGQTLGPLEVLLTVNSTTLNEKTFVASCDAPWLTLEPPSGAIPGVIKAKVTVSALMEGSYETTVTVQSNIGNTDTARITLTVNRLTGEPLTISPNFVDLGTIRLSGGETYGPVSFTVSINGGPLPSQGTQATFKAASDQPWLQVNPATGNVPGTTTVQVTISDRMVGSFTGTVLITTSAPTPSGGVITASGTVIVTVNVERAIGDLLTVSPSTLDVEFTTNNLSPQVFPLHIANADTQGMAFYWSAEVKVPWLRLDPVSGTGATVATLTVDPRLVPVSGSVAGVEGTILFRSNLGAEPVTVTVRLTVVVVTNERLAVYPSYLYWSVVRAGDGTLESFTEEILTVASQNDGWIVWADAPFVTITSLDGVVGGAMLQGSGVGTRLSVTPSAAVLAGYGYGRFEGRIMVSNLSGDALRIVPVTVEIRKPGDPIVPPIPPNTVLQSVPGSVLVETVDTAWFEMLLSAPKSVVQYPSAQACRGAGGMWVDPDGLPGTLDEMCSLDQKIYVLAAVPDAIPGRVYVLSAHHPAGLTEAFINGVKLAGADQWYYSAVPVPYIPIGPLQLLGLYGRVHVSVRLGSDLGSAQEIQRVQINVRTVEGSWLVTETYKGVSYSYGPDRPLSLKRQAPGSAQYIGSWDGAAVTCRPGDGMHQLYLLEFVENGVRYVYEVQSLTGNKMKGRWMFSTSGISSIWETFEGSRLAFVP